MLRPTHMHVHTLLLALAAASTAALLLLSPTSAAAQPVAHHPALSIQETATGVSGIRMAHDPISGQIIVASMNGDLHAAHPSTENLAVTRVYTAADHGTPQPVMGLDIGPDGTMYLVGNDSATQPGYNIGVIRRGVLDGGGRRTWETVAVTEPYPKSNTPFDHNMNAIRLGPGGQFLYVNSGSRTDHGEEQSNGGQFPGVREVALTSAILRVPASATNLVLPAEEEALRQGGYLFADGVRNAFSLAFDGEGRLYGTENSGDRDDNEELNLIVGGAHYGFPWRMGMSDTPMQFAGYDPSSDLLLNPAATAVASGYFHNDPAYPPPPSGVTFTDPVTNVGPDADLFRDPQTGQIVDATGSGAPFGTFTSHRSPLGLVFDTGNSLPDPFTGQAFVLGWTGPESPLLAPFEGEGEDLLLLSFEDPAAGTVVGVQRVASGFQNPIDAVRIGGALYVLEFGSEARIWQVAFGLIQSSESNELPGAIEVSVFPNPAAERVEVEFTAGVSGAVQADLFAANGQRVVRADPQFVPAGNRGRFTFPTSGLAAGVYMLALRAPDRAPVMKQVVILDRP